MIRNLLLLAFAAFLITSCKTSYNPVLPQKPIASDRWSMLADSLQEKLQKSFLALNKQYYAQDNKGNQTFHYWRNAHAMDILTDAYERTNNEMYLSRIKNLHVGIYTQNRHSFINDFYDDMGWLGIAVLRVYKNTNDSIYLNTAKTLWKDLLTGINNRDGRSLSWSKPTPEFKNTPANGPAIIMGLQLYAVTKEKAYRDTAVMLYNWLSQTLINADNALAWDGIKNGNLEKAMYTYNQGLYIGASLAMYQLTHKEEYLHNAIATAKSAIQDTSISPSGILKTEGQGDGGLFKGIFIRYFVALYLEGNLSQEVKNLFRQFLIKNAETLYAKGIDHSHLLINEDWSAPPKDHIDLSTQLSGMMLVEAMSKLDL